MDTHDIAKQRGHLSYHSQPLYLQGAFLMSHLFPDPPSTESIPGVPFVMKKIQTHQFSVTLFSSETGQTGLSLMTAGRKGNTLPLHAVHSRPRGYEGQDPRHQFDQVAGGITLVSS